MTSDQRKQEQTPASIDQFQIEDINILSNEVVGGGNFKEVRKAKQLCRQVAETLDYVLSGDCRDELLQYLNVVSVVPAPNSSRLLVTVSANLPIEEFRPLEILELLERHTGRLRCEIAASINRKRVPTLAFHVVGPLDAESSSNDGTSGT